MKKFFMAFCLGPIFLSPLGGASNNLDDIEIVCGNPFTDSEIEFLQEGLKIYDKAIKKGQTDIAPDFNILYQAILRISYESRETSKTGHMVLLTYENIQNAIARSQSSPYQDIQRQEKKNPKNNQVTEISEQKNKEEENLAKEKLYKNFASLKKSFSPISNFLPKESICQNPIKTKKNLFDHLGSTPTHKSSILYQKRNPKQDKDYVF